MCQHEPSPGSFYYLLVNRPRPFIGSTTALRKKTCKNLYGEVNLYQLLPNFSRSHQKFLLFIVEI